MLSNLEASFLTFSSRFLHVSSKDKKNFFSASLNSLVEVFQKKAPPPKILIAQKNNLQVSAEQQKVFVISRREFGETSTVLVCLLLIKTPSNDNAKREVIKNQL